MRSRTMKCLITFTAFCTMAASLVFHGIKGGAETDITVKEQNLHITAADNGLPLIIL